MKKLLLTLLCLPLIGLSQGFFNSINQFDPDLHCPGNDNHQPYYYPYQDLGLYTNAKLDLLISNCVDFGYNPVFAPDSVYVFGNNNGLFLSGSMNYNSDTALDNYVSNITTPFGPVSVTQTCDYSSKYHPDLYSFSTTGFAGNNAITDNFYYNGGTLATKTRIKNSAQQWTKDFIYDLSGDTLIEINYYTASITTPYRTDILTYSANGNLDNVSISDGRKYEYNYNISSGYCETILLSYYNIFVDTVCEYTFSNDRLQEFSFKSYTCSGGTTSLVLDERKSFTYDSFDRIWTEKWYESDGTLGHTLEFFYFSTPSSIGEEVSNMSLKSKLIKTIDVLGRETNNTNQPLFYIYDDGTVEKRIVIE